MKWYEDPVYIKMAEKAVEIQKLFPKEKLLEDRREFGEHESLFERWNGSWFVINDDIELFHLDNDTDKWMIGCSYGGNEYYEEDVRKSIWLPDQSQLQGMVKDKFIDFREMHLRFCQWLGMDSLQDYFRTLSSMEQLWLAFDHKELYGKVWNREDWIPL